MPRFFRVSRRGDDDDDDWVDPRKAARREAQHRAERPSLASCVATIRAHIKSAPENILAVPLSITLKPYQVEGVTELARRLLSGARGTVLGDEMGLGKTAQAIGVYETLRAHRSTSGPPFTMLIVAPLTTVPSWVAEIRRFCPEARRVVTYTGSREQRDEFVDAMNRHCSSIGCRTGPAPLPPGVSAVVTTPELLMGDEFLLGHLDVSLLVFDEAHRLRSPRSKLGTIVRERLAHVQHRLLMTGTPFHNAAIDFYTLLRCACPSQLPVVEPDELTEENTAKTDRLLADLSAALMVRRLKKDVLSDLPPLTETVVRVPMSPLQHRVYRSLLRRDAGAIGGKGSSTSMHNLVLQLRKCANHPYSFAGVEPEPFTMGEHLIMASGKLLVLDALLKKLLPDGHRVLIFAQFTHMLDILQDYLEYRDFRCSRLDGSVRGDERQSAIDNFQTDDDACVMLLSTRAGGVGITLTAADTVILFDSDWNPQMDLQAMQRAHRVGQTRAVNVLRLVSGETVDDVMVARALAKARAAAATLAERAADVHAGELKDIAAAAAFVGSELSADEWSALCERLKDGLPLEAVLGGEGGGPQRAQPGDAGVAAETSVYRYMQRSYDDMVKAGAKAVEDIAAELKALQAADGGSGDTLLSRRARRGVADLADFDWGEDGDGPAALPPSDRQRRAAALSPEEKLAKMREAHEKKVARWRAKGYTSRSVHVLEEMGTGEDDDDAEGGTSIEHITASATAPPDTLAPPPEAVGDATGTISKAQRIDVTVVPVNNSGTWGHGGLFAAVDRVDVSIGKAYETAKAFGDLRLGDVLWFDVDNGPVIALAVIQRSSTASSSSGGSFDPKLLDVACLRLRYAARRALESRKATHTPSTVAFFLPAFGSSKTDVYASEKVIQAALGGRLTASTAVRIFRCHVPRGPRPARGAGGGGHGGHRGGRAVQPHRTTAPAAAAAQVPPASPPPPPGVPHRLETPFEETSFAFLGFSDDPTVNRMPLLHALQRLVLLHGGIVVPVPTSPEEWSPADGQLVVVIPARDHPISDSIVALHEAGSLVVEPSWLQRKTGADGLV